MINLSTWFLPKRFQSYFASIDYSNLIFLYIKIKIWIIMIIFCEYLSVHCLNIQRITRTCTFWYIFLFQMCVLYTGLCSKRKKSITAFVKRFCYTFFHTGKQFENWNIAFCYSTPYFFIVCSKLILFKLH